MPPRKKTGPSSPSEFNPSLALSVLQKQLEQGTNLADSGNITIEEYVRWRTTTSEFINKAFGSASSNQTAFHRAGDMGLGVLGGDRSHSQSQNKENLLKKLVIVRSCVDQLEALVASQHVPDVLEKIASSKPSKPKDGRVFLVHGRNDGVRESVARFLEKLSMPVTILHEQSNRGRTVIEKFEDHAAEVGFAVVLLTGDDKGGLSTDSVDTYRFRARQNVIFELGYFLAKLGRGRVCALYEQGVEIPSDYSGVLFVELDPNRRWHVELAKELKAADFSVDMNKAFE